MPNLLTLDKSYIRSVRSQDLLAVSDAYRLVLPMATVFEILKDPADKRAKLMRKFWGGKKQPYSVASDIAQILQSEIKTRSPFVHSRSARSTVRHVDYANLDFELTAHDRKLIAERASELAADMKEMKSLASSFKEEFPTAFRGGKNEHNLELIALREKLCSEAFVRSRFEYAVRNRLTNIEDHLRPSDLTPGFAHFRWFQVMGLFACELAARHSDLSVLDSGNARAQLNHDVLDAQTIVTALSVGGAFATNEKKLIDMWRFLKPSGRLITQHTSTRDASLPQSIRWYGRSYVLDPD